MTVSPDGLSVADQSIGDFLAGLADRVPAPGGGASAALHGAQAAALIAMVARYTTGPKYVAYSDQVERIIAESDALRVRCIRLADEDAAAFTSVTSAYGLPKESNEDKESRRSAIEDALVGAAQPPCDVVSVSLQLITLAESLIPFANRNVITDIAAATEAARAAAVTARLNVEVNAVGIKDDATRVSLRSVLGDVNDICVRAERVDSEVRDLL